MLVSDYGFPAVDPASIISIIPASHVVLGRAVFGSLISYRNPFGRRVRRWCPFDVFECRSWYNLDANKTTCTALTESTPPARRF